MRQSRSHHAPLLAHEHTHKTSTHERVYARNTRTHAGTMHAHVRAHPRGRMHEKTNSRMHAHTRLHARTTNA